MQKRVVNIRENKTGSLANKEEYTMDEQVESLANELFGGAETETETTEEVEVDGNEQGTFDNSDDQEEAGSTDGSEEETEHESVEQPEQDEEIDKTGRAFAQMRVQNKELQAELAKMKDVLNRLADAQGTDTDSLLTKLEDDADEVQAKKQNMDPQMYKRIRQLEEAEAARTQEASRERFSRRLVEFNHTANLSDSELRQFFSDAAAEGFDLVNTNLDFMKVYRGIYHDQILAKQEESVRQAELAKQKKAQQSTPSMTKSKGTSTTEVKSGDLDSILSDLSKSFKMNTK